MHAVREEGVTPRSCRARGSLTLTHLACLIAHNHPVITHTTRCVCVCVEVPSFRPFYAITFVVCRNWLLGEVDTRTDRELMESLWGSFTLVELKGKVSAGLFC